MLENSFRMTKKSHFENSFKMRIKSTTPWIEQNEADKREENKKKLMNIRREIRKKAYILTK